MNEFKLEFFSFISRMGLVLACSTSAFEATAQAGVENSKQDRREPSPLSRKELSRVFLNASMNREGNTAKLAQATFKGLPYKSINLVDYQIDQLGQQSKNDEYFKVIDQLSGADVLIIGTPVYWSNMSGHLKTFIDRLSDIMEKPLDSDSAPLNGIDVYLVVQGTDPRKAIPGITTVIEHISKRFFMNYKGIILNTNDADKVNKNLRAEEQGAKGKH